MTSTSFVRPLAVKVPPEPAPPSRSLPWGSLGFVGVWALAVPFSVYLALALLDARLVATLLAVVASGYGITAAAVALEAVVAGPRRNAPFSNPWVRNGTHMHARMPKVTALIVAYLPNEQDLIVETVEHFLTQVDVPAESLQVLLAYNTPDALPVVSELRAIAARDGRFQLLHVEGSRSKAENVNAAVPLIKGVVVGIFDADHRPEPACFRKALPWLVLGYDVVQGRCVIREPSSWLSRLIGLEYGTMYAVSHTARSLGADLAIFGGSNGYWRASRLAACPFDSTMLTEDIDATVRMLSAGFRIVHDRSIISTELAPASVQSWLFQRLRWAQGWHQVTRRHSAHLLTRGHFSWAQRIYLAYTLPWREVYTLLAPQALPMLVAIVVVQAVFGGSWYWDPYLTGTTVLTFASGTVLTLSAWKHQRENAEGPWVLAVYLVLSPVIALVRSLIALTAWVQEARQNHQWIVTPRPRAARVMVDQHLAGVEPG